MTQYSSRPDNLIILIQVLVLLSRQLLRTVLWLPGIRAAGSVSLMVAFRVYDDDDKCSYKSAVTENKA